MPTARDPGLDVAWPEPRTEGPDDGARSVSEQRRQAIREGPEMLWQQGPELVEDRQQGDIGGPLTSVVNLQGEAHAWLADCAEEHAFGPALDDHGAGSDLHDHRAQSSRPDDQLRMRRHRRAHPARGGGPPRRETPR